MQESGRGCPQGSGCALSVTFGDTSPKGRGKKHSHYALGTLSKERQETFPPRSWLSLWESWRKAPERAHLPADYPFPRWRNTSRRGADAPSPSPSVTPLPKGEARSTPIMPLAPFQKSDKKRSLHGLGSPFGRAGAKRLRGLISPLTTRFLDGAILPQGASSSNCCLPLRPFP